MQKAYPQSSPLDDEIQSQKDKLLCDLQEVSDCVIKAIVCEYALAIFENGIIPINE